MQKYAVIFRTSFRSNMRTWVNTVMRVATFCLVVLVMMVYWRVIYKSGGTIGGFTFPQMLSYVLFGELCYNIHNGRYTIDDITRDIRTGKIAYLLSKPFNYFFYSVISYGFAFSIMNILFLFPFGVLLNFLLVGTWPALVSIVPLLISLILAGFINALLYSLVGMLAFWVENANPFHWIVSKTFLLFGVLFPPAIFPALARTVIEYSPIHAMFSGPSTLFVNFTWEGFGLVTAVQVGYIVLFGLFGLWVLRRGRKKVTANGG